MLAEFAQHRIRSTDIKRGQDLFGAGQGILPSSSVRDTNSLSLLPDKAISNDFFTLVLESIKVWPRLFPTISDFKTTYNQLNTLGVVFPSELSNYQ